MNKTYCYSFDGEYYYGECSSIKEAIEESKGEYQYIDDDGEHLFIYVGEKVPFEPQIDGELVVDNLVDQALDSCGDYADNYLEDISIYDMESLSKRLTDTFNTWAKEVHQKPNFFSVVNIHKYSYKDYPDE